MEASGLEVSRVQARQQILNTEELQHQFEDMKQQEESNTIGMWMFLAQEIMFFGGLFTAYFEFLTGGPLGRPLLRLNELESAPWLLIRVIVAIAACCVDAEVSSLHRAT